MKISFDHTDQRFVSVLKDGHIFYTVSAPRNAEDACHFRNSLLDVLQFKFGLTRDQALVSFHSMKCVLCDSYWREHHG